MEHIYGGEIIEMLEEQNIELSIQVKNTIDKIAFEVFQKGEKEGVKKGVKMGKLETCNRLANKIKAMEYEAL